MVVGSVNADVSSFISSFAGWVDDFLSSHPIKEEGFCHPSFSFF